MASLYEAHALKRDLSTELVLEEIRATKPAVRASAPRKSQALRDWALERTVLAD